MCFMWLEILPSYMVAGNQFLHYFAGHGCFTWMSKEPHSKDRRRRKMQGDEGMMLTTVDEDICAFFIEDASRLRRIVELMSEGDMSANFLNTLWAYAVRHDRLFDLANVFLGFDANHKTVEGNENCDWFWQTDLPDGPIQVNNFFYELITYARTRAHLARGTYDEWHGSSLAMHDWLTFYKEHDVGKGIIDIDYVLAQLYAKYEAEVELERRREESGYYTHLPSSDQPTGV